MPGYKYHHTHLMSRDALAAGRYYVTMFDATMEESKGANGLPRANLSLGDHTILISTVEHNRISGDGPHSVIGIDHFGLLVSDLKQSVIDLKLKGAEFFMEPRYSDTISIAFVKAPDGVRVELIGYS
jgi:hypothetical protein|tara:strand:+ start:344 stop:724 length:381 start_codon:yes stop_codon:yes gene_type:complete